MVRHLRENPMKIEGTLRFAKNTKVKEEGMDEATEVTSFHSTYRRLYRVPKDFLRAWLPTLCAIPLFLTDEKLLKIEKTEDGATRNIFYTATGTSPDSPWPQFGHPHENFKAIFEAVHRDLGNRIQHLVLKNVGDKIFIDWKKFGVFHFEPETFPKTHVVHISGERAELEDFAIRDDSYTIVDNHSLSKSSVVVKGRTTRCLELFQEEQKNTFRLEAAGMKDRIQAIANDVENRRVEGEAAGQKDM